MKVRKAIKKIVALGVGVTMMGATLLGATAAADLADFPSFLIENGKFDGYFVVGDNAISQDVVGITAIASRMQAESVKTTYVSVGAAGTSSVDDGIKFDKSSDHLYLDVDLEDLYQSFDETDLPVLLAKGTYDENEGDTDNDEEYTQEFSFTDANGVVGVYQDDEDAPEAGWYLFFDNNAFMYTYMLEFDGTIDYVDSDDLEGTEIEMQGQLYTILKADLDGADVLDKLTLMAGETVLWLQQGESVTRVVDGSEHEIEMIDVTASEDSCGFKVDGSTVWVDVDDTETKNGVTIGVLDAKAVYTEKQDADICRVNIGASELVLEEGQEVRMNGKDIDGSDVAFDAAANTWDGMTITYTADDELYLGADDEVQDPVFGNFKFIVGGLVQQTEELSLETSGKDAELKFMNNDNREVVLPFYTDEVNVFLGDGDDINDRVYQDSEVCDYSGTGDIGDCEGAMFLAISSGYEAHLYEITDVDTNNLEFNFEDLTYGSEYKDKDYAAGHNPYSLNVGNIDIVVNLTDDYIEFRAIDLGAGYVETKYEGQLSFELGDQAVFSIDFDEDPNSDRTPDTLTLDLEYVGSPDDEIQITGADWAAGVGEFDFSDDNNDDQWLVSDEHGTMVLYDDEDKRSAVVTYPEEPAWLEVFFAPTSAQLLEGGSSGDVATETVQQISSKAVKLAAEVTEGIKNVNAIVVGGPCANNAAAVLMGNPANCAEGFEEGHAKIALFENAGNVQMLVAGYSAADSRRASEVVANFEKYADDLVGTEVDVTGTSMTDISVDEPMVDTE